MTGTMKCSVTATNNPPTTTSMMYCPTAFFCDIEFHHGVTEDTELRKNRKLSSQNLRALRVSVVDSLTDPRIDIEIYDDCFACFNRNCLAFLYLGPDAEIARRVINDISPGRQFHAVISIVIDS